MKLTTPTLLSTTLLTPILATSPPKQSTYQLRVQSSNPSLNNTLAVLRDTDNPITPNPLGVFSTGEPRYPYTFVFVPSSLSPALSEIITDLGTTHLIATGNPIARGLFDVPLGADPVPTEGEELNTKSWLTTGGVGDQAPGSMNLYLGENKPKGGGMGQTKEEFMSAGSMRACLGESEVDFTFYWFDGLHALDQLVKGCESVSLQLEEVETPDATITGVPSPTDTSSGFITGVPAPTDVTSGFITGVPAPDSTSGFITGIPAPDSTSGFITGVPAPSDTTSGFITGVPAPSDITSGFITGVPAPSNTYSGYLTGVGSPVGTSTSVPEPESFLGSGSQIKISASLLVAVVAGAAVVLL